MSPAPPEPGWRLRDWNVGGPGHTCTHCAVAVRCVSLATGERVAHQVPGAASLAHTPSQRDGGPPGAGTVVRGLQCGVRCPAMVHPQDACTGPRPERHTCTTVLPSA